MGENFRRFLHLQKLYRFYEQGFYLDEYNNQSPEKMLEFMKSCADFRVIDGVVYLSMNLKNIYEADLECYGDCKYESFEEYISRNSAELIRISFHTSHFLLIDFWSEIFKVDNPDTGNDMHCIRIPKSLLKLIYTKGHPEEDFETISKRILKKEHGASWNPYCSVCDLERELI